MALKHKKYFSGFIILFKIYYFSDLVTDIHLIEQGSKGWG